MKKYFLTSFVLANLFFGFSNSALSIELGEQFITSTGAAFIYVQDPIFGLAWRAPDGKLWGSAVGLFDHKDFPGTKPIDGIVQKSHATEACRHLNAQLPSLEDYKTLHFYFEKKPGTRILSNRGLSDVHQMFPDLVHYSYYWTSTVVPGDSQLAFIFDGVYGTLGSGVSERFLEVYVQCVFKK